MRPDPTFYPSAALAMQAPPEDYAFVALLAPPGSGEHDALGVVDVRPDSPERGQIVHVVSTQHTGDEFHHFGWNACSSALSPIGGHPFVERRHLIVPGLRSSRIYVIDAKDPLKAEIHKVIEPEEVFARTGYSRPHTIHCGPEGIYVSTLGGSGEDGTDGPPGIFIMDCQTFEVIGRYEMDRGPQKLHYDFWWNLPRDYMVSSEWGLPPQFENGLVAEDLLANRYGHQLHFWNLRERRNVQTIDLGANHQMALEVRPAHDPVREYGFCGVVVDTETLEGAIFTWWRDDTGTFHAAKTATIPPRPADPDSLPDLLKGFGAVPPLITDIDLSLDDRYLYVACWGTGEMRQYDVSNPMQPELNGVVTLGGVAQGTPHPQGPFAYGPQMVEISRDGRRVYWTNSLYSTWDDQFYPNDAGGQMVMATVDDDGTFALDPTFYMQAPNGLRAHQIRLQGGDCSTDSFCYPSV